MITHHGSPLYPRILKLFGRQLSSQLTDDDEIVEYRPLLPNHRGEDPDRYRWRDVLILRNLIQHALHLFAVLLPSFLQPLVTRRPNKPIQLYSTSWLDGIRGFASLFVFVFHFVKPFHTAQDYGLGRYNDGGLWNTGDVENNGFWIMRLPIIRTVYSGPSMVSVFFVVSGFALSHKPIMLLRQQEWTRLFSTITSATFKRPIRLLCPVAVSGFITFLLIQLGVYEVGRNFASSPIIQHPELRPLRISFFAQFGQWLVDTLGQVNFLSSSDVQYGYGRQTWTISAETRGSYILFILIIALCRAKAYLRLLLFAGASCFCLMAGSWEYFCFIWGIILSELNWIRLESCKDEVEVRQLKPSDLSWMGVFILSLYLLSSPRLEADHAPGYALLETLNPLVADENHYRFWHLIGSILLVWSTGNCIALQAIFTTSVAQYLAKISFALYLVHIFIIDSLGYPIIKAVWDALGMHTPWRYEFGWGLTLIILFPIVICTADLFWRVADIPCLTLARWAESKLFKI